MAPSFTSSLLLALASSIVAQCIVQDPANACSKFASTFTYPDLTIYSGTHIPAGTNITLPDDASLATCDRPYQVVDVEICRLTMYVKTSAESGIHLEAFLPTNWTGRFLSTGNGGTGGCIQYEDIAYGASLGFASVAANNGHNGTSGVEFAIPGVLEDFVWRSLYTETVVGKAITKAFYELDITKSYYLGCSTGGRQGFKMAHSYPELFDGIVAGAPAIAFNNQPLILEWTFSSDCRDEYLRDLSDSSSVGSRPSGCDQAMRWYRRCAAQVQTVSAVLSPYYGEHGSLIFPRLQPGAEASAARLYFTGAPFAYTQDWLRYAILNDTTWDPATLNSETAAIASTLNPYNAETWEGDLSAFRYKGGKILHYHGQADPIISSSNSPRYYEHVVTTMRAAPEEPDEFYRFFCISGMAHCYGGAGASIIGQGAGGSVEPERNILMRMVEWVEMGDEAAPESVMGVKFVDDNPVSGVKFERKHCKYPLRNHCKDPENYKSADAWECVI